MKLIPLPSRSLLRSLLNYNKKTGVVTWKVRRGAVWPGKVVGGRRPNSSGYLRVAINRRLYYLHRIIWKMETGKDPGHTVDHKNKIKTKNNWTNLRRATWSQQHMNKGQRANKDGLKGIRKVGKHIWMARVYIKRREIILGKFKTKKDAIFARKQGEHKYYGEYAS